MNPPRANADSPTFPVASPDAAAAVEARGLGAPANRCGVVVLGMGRSGTSAVTRAFHLSGYFAGAESELLPGDHSNPTGHFEHWDVYRANEQALARLNGMWFEVPDEVGRHAGDPDYVGPLRDVLSRLLSEAGESPLVLKDPRIGTLLELWWPLIEDLLHPVLVVRDPLEVAHSLEKRDLTALPVGLAMWELHVTRLLAGLSNRRVTVIPYRSVLEAPRLASRLVAEASATLRPGLRACVDPSNAESALESRHRRNVREELDGEAWLTRHQQRLWQLLGSLAPGATVLHPPDWATRPSREARVLTAYELRRQHTHSRLARDVAEAARSSAELVAARDRLASHEAALEDLGRAPLRGRAANGRPRSPAAAQRGATGDGRAHAGDERALAGAGPRLAELARHGAVEELEAPRAARAPPAAAVAPFSARAEPSRRIRTTWPRHESRPRPSSGAATAASAARRRAGGRAPRRRRRARAARRARQSRSRRSTGRRRPCPCSPWRHRPAAAPASSPRAPCSEAWSSPAW